MTRKQRRRTPSSERRRLGARVAYALWEWIVDQRRGLDATVADWEARAESPAGVAELKRSLDDGTTKTDPRTTLLQLQPMREDLANPPQSSASGSPSEEEYRRSIRQHLAEVRELRDDFANAILTLPPGVVPWRIWDRFVGKRFRRLLAHDNRSATHDRTNIAQAPSPLWVGDIRADSTDQYARNRALGALVGWLKAWTLEWPGQQGVPRPPMTNEQRAYVMFTTCLLCCDPLEMLQHDDWTAEEFRHTRTKISQAQDSVVSIESALCGAEEDAPAWYAPMQMDAKKSSWAAAIAARLLLEGDPDAPSASWIHEMLRNR